MYKIEETIKKYPKSYKYVNSHLVVPHRYCNRCGCHVLESDLKDYQYQCMYCDEDLYEFETHTKENDFDEISDFDFVDMIEQVSAILLLDEE